MDDQKIIDSIRDHNSEDFKMDYFWKLDDMQMHDIIAEFDCAIHGLCLDLAKAKDCSADDVLKEAYDLIADHLTEAWIDD